MPVGAGTMLAKCFSAVRHRHNFAARLNRWCSKASCPVRTQSMDALCLILCAKLRTENGKKEKNVGLTMKPVFNIRKDENLYITDTWFSNGHWVFKRDILKFPRCPKPLLALENLKFGRYIRGIVGGAPTEIELPNMFDSVIPKREGYRLVSDFPIGVTFKNETEVSAYKYRVDVTSGQTEFEIGVAHRYVPLLSLGYAFAKTSSEPILLFFCQTN